MKTLLALATMALALILPATAGAATVGTTTVHSGGASTAKGVAKAYRFTAPSTGQVDRLNVYLDGASTASKVEVGLYSGSDSSAGTRRGWCVISSPQANAWNRCSFTAYSISAGAYYWLALLHPSGSSGKLQYREGQVSGAPASYLSRNRSLPSLPSTWTNASRSSGAYQASIYADQAGSPPPDGDGDGVPDSSDQCPGTPAGTPVDANGCPTTLPPPTPTPEPPAANFSVTPNPAVWGQAVAVRVDGHLRRRPCTYRWFHGGATSTDEIEAGAAQPNTKASVHLHGEPILVRAGQHHAPRDGRVRRHRHGNEDVPDRRRRADADPDSGADARPGSQPCGLPERVEHRVRRATLTAPLAI